MGDVIYARFGPEPLLSKAELGEALDRSVRWVEQKTAQGMPSTIDGSRRMYYESECRNWLAGQDRKVANG